MTRPLFKKSSAHGKKGKTPSAGRVKDPQKHEAIVEAARSLFFARGVEDIGIEEIAEQAGVSKVTVYGHFGSKEAILSAVVAMEARRMTEGLELAPGDARSLAERLVEFGIVLLTFLTRPDILAFERLVIAQSSRHPEMARAMLEAGPRFGHRMLAETLSKATPKDGVRFPDCNVAAGYLMSLWQGMLLPECRLGARPRPKRDEVEAHIRSVSAFFLKAYAIRAKGE